MVEPVKVGRGWLRPAPGQTQAMGAGVQMQRQREHNRKQQEELDQLHNIAKDVAANLTQQAYQDARIQQQGNLQYQKTSLQFPLKTEGETFGDKVKKFLTGPVLELFPTATIVAGGAGVDTLAPSQRDPWTKAAYLPDQYKYQNTEVALGRALAAHPELITKPYLLMTAALSDMQAHDVKYLATMDDMMKIYATAIMSDDGLKNASESMYKRIMASPGVQMAQGVGGGVQKVIEFTGELQTDLEAILASAAGRTVEKVGGGKGMQPASLNISGGEGVSSAIFGGAQTVANVAGGIWRNTGEHLFGIQHAIRTESNIRRTQGDAQANLYLGTWFSTAALLNASGKGFALALKGLEKTALKSTLEKAGVSGAEKATLEQLHILAQGAKLGDKRWMRLIQASQDWLMHASANTEVRNKLIAAYARKGMDEPMLGRYGREALNVAEDASGSEWAGAFLSRNLSPTGKILKDVSTYGTRHAHIPLNLELAAQLVSNTNGFGLGHEWDKSWEKTTDGEKYMDPITHAPISFGREVATAVGAEPNTWWYNMVSGPLDFLSWFAFDPFQAILNPISQTKQLENTGMLKRVYGGIGIRSATDVYNLNARSPKFRAFVDKVVDINKEAIPHRLETAERVKKTRLETIAKKTAAMKKKGFTQAQIDARIAASKKMQPFTDEQAAAAARRLNPKASSISRIYKNFPELSHAVRPSELEAGENFMKLLSEAESKEDVVELFASVAEAHQYLNTYRAPSYSRFMSYKDWARVQVEGRIEARTEKLIAEGRYADAAKSAMDNKFYRMFTSMKPVYWDEYRKFSNRVIKIGDPKSLDLLGRVMRASGVNPLTADLLVNRLAMSNSSLEWKTVYWNWAKDTFNLQVESQLAELVAKAGMTPQEAKKARNLLSSSFGHAVEELGNPFGGGGSRNVYSGADVNNIVDAKRPFPSGGEMTETAGLGSMHEHYLPMFDYNTLDNIVRDVSKYLKSNNGRREMIDAINDTLAKPINDKLANVQKQMKAVEANYVKMTGVAAAPHTKDPVWLDLKKRSDQLKADKAKIPDDQKLISNPAWVEVQRRSEQLEKEKDAFAASAVSSDPAWLTLKEESDKLRKDKSDLITAATGDYKFYEVPERAQMMLSNGAHYVHTQVRQRLIDDYFRKMALSTGSFSMRVSISEAIPNAFRVGVSTYTKASLGSHVERAARQYAKDYNRVVSLDEMTYIQKRIHGMLTSLTKEEIDFYGKSFPSELKRYTRRIERDFVKGLTSGKSFDKFVERMTKDALLNGYSVGGLSADHADVYQGGKDAIGAQFRNLANGQGTGHWAQNSEIDTESLAGLGKVWQDIAQDPMQRTTASILDDYMQPLNFPGATFQERLDAATIEINKVTKQMVRNNPGLFDNMDRAAKGKLLATTRDRIAAEILAENGLAAGTPIRGRLLDQLKDRLQKVDSLEEWASANIQHILWASHGRGSMGGFSFPDMGDRVFHRRVLSMLGKGEAPTKVNEVEKLIITPDAEHARVLQRMKSSAKEEILPPRAKAEKGGERLRYHEVLYNPSSRFHDQSTFDALTEGAETIPKLIAKHKPRLAGVHGTRWRGRAGGGKATGKRAQGVAKRYADTGGVVHALFPDKIPVQSGKHYDAPNFVDRFSDRLHDTVSRRVIDSVARRPLYGVELNAQLDFLEPLVKSGAITEDLAFSIAQSRAINQGIKYVHNPQDRMVFEQWSRAYAPFWFAQNQALKRMGRLALQNPAAFEKYMLLQLMFMESGARGAESTGSNGTIVLPGSMFGGRAFTSFLKTFGFSPSGNVPIGLAGSLTSLNSVFPWNDTSGLHTGSPMAMLEHLRPQFGPLVAMPIKWLESIRPYGMHVPFTDINISTRGISESVLGDVGANVGMMHAAIPNPAFRAVAGSLSFIASGGRNVSSELTNPISAIQYGLIPQYFADKSSEIMKKAQAQAKRDWNNQWGGPEAADPNHEDYKDYKNFIADETLSYITNGYEDPSNPNRGFKGMAEYMSDPMAREALVRDTSIAAQIVYLGRTAISFFSPLSTQATQVQPELQKFIHDLYGTKGQTQKIIDLLKTHPETMAFLVASQSSSKLGIQLDASINMGIYQEQNQDLFKDSRTTAGVAMLLPYHKKGSERDSHVYNLQKDMGLRAKYTPDEYIKNIARKWGNEYVFEYLPLMTEELYGGDDTRQRELAGEHAKQNIPWAESLNEGNIHRKAAFASLENVLNIKGIEKRPGLKETVPLARQLISDYRDYQSDLAQAMPGNFDVIQGEWQQHVEAFRKKNPVASVLIDSLFKNLSLRDVR